ncbi:hypothetical protein [Veillonella atypica]|uniref:hypothetical protein n=1 Tax=Veillonella atypica TaxID=39777 RepID=UPI00399347CA
MMIRIVFRSFPVASSGELLHRHAQCRPGRVMAFPHPVAQGGRGHAREHAGVHGADLPFVGDERVDDVLHACAQQSCHLPGHVSRIAAEHTMASSPAALMYRVCAGRARISWIHCQSSPRAASISPESILHASNVASSMIDACSHVMGIAGICRVTASGSAPAGASSS